MHPFIQRSLKHEQSCTAAGWWISHKVCYCSDLRTSFLKKHVVGWRLLQLFLWRFRGIEAVSKAALLRGHFAVVIRILELVTYANPDHTFRRTTTHSTAVNFNLTFGSH